MSDIITDVWAARESVKNALSILDKRLDWCYENCDSSAMQTTENKAVIQELRICTKILYALLNGDDKKSTVRSIERMTNDLKELIQ